MPENPVLPKPTEVLGGGSKLPSPAEAFSPKKTTDTYSAALSGEIPENNLDDIVNSIPDLDETKKKIYKNLALKRIPQPELSSALLTLQGKHPIQDGGDKYYYNAKGIPTPLRSDERPPKGFDVANDLHGTQDQANEDGFLKSAGKHLYNGVIKGVLGLEGLANLPYAMATGEDADWYKSAKNRAESSLYKTPEYETEKQLFDSKDMKGIEDFFDSDRYNLDKNTLQGAALNGLESVTSFLVGTKGLGAAGKIVGGAAEGAGLLTEGGKTAQFIAGTSKPGVLTQAFGGSYAITLPEVLDYMDENGITGKEKYALAAAIAVPVALTELIGGVEGQFAKNSAAKSAKSQMIKGLVEGAKKTVDETGSLSKEFLGDVFKATTSESLKLQKSFFKDVAGNIAGEGITEGMQDLEKKGLAEIYDNISKEDKFKENPLSIEAFGDYYNSALNGAAGAGGMSTVATIQKRKIEVQKKQSENIFEAVKQGPEAVNVLKMNIDKAVQDGEITPEQGAESVFKVDAYHAYNEQTKDFTLSDEDKRRVFDLTFEKANLEQSIPTDYEAEKLNAIEQAKIDVKKTKAKDIQDEINKIILRDDVQNKAATTAKKTEEQVTKDQESELEKLKQKTPIKSTKGEAVFDENLPEGIKKSEDDFVYTPSKSIINEKRSYEETPVSDFNKPSFNFGVKLKQLGEHILKNPKGVIFGTIQQDNEFIDNGHRVDTLNVTLPDGKTARFASSMKLRPVEGAAGGYRGNTYEENFDNRDTPIGAKIGLRAHVLPSGRTVVAIFNAEPGPKYGKHLGFIKERKKGDSIYSKEDSAQFPKIQSMVEPMEGGESVAETEPSPVKPISPADVKVSKSKVQLGVPSREKYIADKIEELKNTPGAYAEGINYEDILGTEYDIKQAGGKKLYLENLNKKNEPKQGPEGATTGGEKSATGNNETSNAKSTEVSKEIKTKKPRAKRLKQKIKDPNRLKALTHDVYEPYHKVLQYFAGNGAISTDAIKELYKGSQKEVFARNAYTLSAEIWGDKIAPSLSELAHSLWAENEDTNPNATTEDYANAIEDAVQKYLTRSDMAIALNEAMTEGEQKAPNEDEVGSAYNQSEKEGTQNEFNSVTTNLEKLSNEELTKIANDQKSYDQWEGEQKDIITGEDGDVFQKSQELVYAEGQLAKADAELKASKKALDVKRKELDQGLIADQEDLFGERKSTDETSLFDERATVDARNEAIVPFKQRYENALKNYVKWQDKVKSLADSEEGQMELFQKMSEKRANVEKIVDKLKKSIPGIKVVFDENLNASGKWSPSNKTITINPYYAGLDTPIHEYGHILIDAIGYNNRVIQSAIKQLKGSSLWIETENRYPELDEENLGKEVLAEAIGREGAGIFDKEADKSKFKQLLDYIFNWLKTKLGLNKNIAKSLAKQVISGRGVVAKEGKEQLQKVKETPEEKQQRKEEKKARTAEQKYELKQIMGDQEIKDLSFEKLVKLYNHVIGYEKSIQDKYFGDIKTQIAYRLFTEKKAQLEKWQKEGKVSGYNEEEANKSDIKKKDILMKNLAHMTQIVPELQAFSKMFENAYFDMTAERYTLKNELQKLGKEVIKEANKKLGIVGRAIELFSSDNAKYFEYLENPNAIIGEDEDGNPIRGAAYWTLEEGKKKGFNKAQMDFLKFMHKLQDERNTQLEQMGRDLNNEVLKVDKGVAESWRTEGLMSAFSSFLGNGFNIRNVRINYNGTPMTYGEVEKKLIEQGNKGGLDKLVALKDLFKYNMAAKRQIQKGIHVDEDNETMLQQRGGAKYGIDPHGALINKFMKNRNKDRGYSKDFYKAAFEFIDDSTHSKHMQELLPYIDSIEYLNKTGLLDEDGNVLHGVKDNVAEWVSQWKDLHLFKVEKPGALGPEADAAMKFLRTLTSQLVMAFNFKAGLINIAMGQYNNFRKETAAQLKEGHKRMATDPKKTADILSKYQVISIDYDSNPKLFAGKLFDYLAHGLTRAGEYYIQGSMFMGLMTEKEYNSFEYKKNKDGVEELVLKPGVDEKAFKEDMIKNKNRVSDIQGKYAEKDRRNFMAGEFGKMVSQFKVWIPDWWKERFGQEYITADGQVKKGSYRNFTLDALKDLREQVKAEGPKAIWNNKEAMTNLKGALTVATLWSLSAAGGDDNKRKKGDLLSQMVSNVLFVFDPGGLKFTATHPAAALGTIEKFLTVFEDVVKGDGEKFGKDIVKVIPYNKMTKIPEQLGIE